MDKLKRRFKDGDKDANNPVACAACGQVCRRFHNFCHRCGEQLRLHCLCCGHLIDAETEVAGPNDVE
jgi:predicted amidophosphoribosyltransferase